MFDASIGFTIRLSIFWQSVALLEGLLQHGRLTLQQMLDRAESSQNESKFILLCL